MPATWAAIPRRKSMSPELNSRRSVLWTLSTPTSLGPDSIGTDAMEWNRSSSRPGTHFQCGSLLTSGTTAGRRESATQPVIPSPTLILTLPTMFSFRPLVAVSSSSLPEGSTRYREQTSVPIAAVVSRLARVRDVVDGFSDLYSSVHRGTGYKSRLSTEAYEHARELVARFLCVDESDQVVIFVKGTTDALNRIAAEEARLDGRQVLVTEMEHHADLLPWRHRSGHVMVGLSDDGHIDLEAIEHALEGAEGRISLVAVCGASNVTGFVSPIHEAAERAP